MPTRDAKSLKFPALCMALAIAGCETYRAQPLSPQEMQAALARRNLNDPDLLAFVNDWGGALAKVAASAPATGPATEPVTGASGWDLEHLSRAAIWYHPDLAAARAHLGAVSAGEITAGEMPNPTAGFSPTWVTKTAGANPWTIGWTFDIPIETAGKREFRIAQAKALTEAAKMELAESVWHVRRGVRDALADDLLSGRELALHAKEVADRQHYVDLLEARLKAGEAARPEVDTARIDLLGARQAWHAAQGKQEEAGAKLATAIGMTAAGLQGADLNWPDIDQFEAVSNAQASALRTAGLLNRLDVRRSLKEYAAAEADLQLQIAKQYPDIHLGPGYEFDQGENKWTIGLNMELPILNQNGGAIAEARGRRSEQAAKLLALQAAAIGELESAEARYASALSELDSAKEQVEAAQRQAEAGRHGLELGEEDRLTVTGQEVQVDVAELLRLDAIRKAREAAGAIEDAIQRPLKETTQETTVDPTKAGA